MKRTKTAALIILSIFVHLFVCFARLIDPIEWQSVDTVFTAESEEKIDDSGWTRETSVINQIESYEPIEAKEWIEPKRKTIGYLESDSSTSEIVKVYELGFGIFESAVLVSLILHIATILHLKRRWSNQKSAHTTPVSAPR